MTSDLDHTPASLRALRGYTKDRLCKQVGIGFETLRAIESGETSSRMDTVESVAAALDVPLTTYVAAMARAKALGSGSAA